MKKLITFAFIIFFAINVLAQVPAPTDSVRQSSTNSYVGSGYMWGTLSSLLVATFALNARDSLLRRGEFEKGMAQQKIAVGATGVTLGINLIYVAKENWPFGSNP